MHWRDLYFAMQGGEFGGTDGTPLADHFDSEKAAEGRLYPVLADLWADRLLAAFRIGDQPMLSWSFGQSSQTAATPEARRHSRAHGEAAASSAKQKMHSPSRQPGTGCPPLPLGRAPSAVRVPDLPSALKDDQNESLRMFALHRSGSYVQRWARRAHGAREWPGFNLQAQIDHGVAHFSEGDLVDLELRARGYVVGLLLDCRLADGQRVEDEPDGSPFKARVFAGLPGSGQLLHWLLGCGDNVEVVGPADLRRVMAVQAAKVMALYDVGD